jgi:nucleotide-binding universal stress UspA family protein
MRHILVPTDFGEGALAALEYAVELCQGSQGRITLLHVLHKEKTTETLMGLDAIGYLSNALELPPSSSGCAPAFNVDELTKLARQTPSSAVELNEDAEAIAGLFVVQRPRLGSGRSVRGFFKSRSPSAIGRPCFSTVRRHEAITRRFASTRRRT